MKCQATRTDEATVELPSQSPDGPYYLSAEAAKRLEKLCLRPLEWFNLATIHGPFEYYLHDDFYTEDGEACQPEGEVVHAARFPCPSLMDCAGTLPRLLDFAVTRWHLSQPILEAFAPHKRDLLETIQRRFALTKNPWFQERLVEVAGSVLEQQAQGWFRGVALELGPQERLSFLHVGHRCLPHDEGLRAAEQSLAELPPNELTAQCLVLAHFRNPAVLNWIEANVTDPLTQQWGDLAAASELEWDRVSKWLQSGRPLSLVALDAMIACKGPRPDQSLLIQSMQPRLRSAAPVSAIEAALNDYAARDRAPRVSQAVRYIVANLPALLSRE